MILDQTTGAPNDAAEQQKMEVDMEEDYRMSMYRGVGKVTLADWIDDFSSLWQMNNWPEA